MMTVWCKNSFHVDKFIQINLLSPVRGEASPEGECKLCQGWFREEPISEVSFYEYPDHILLCPFRISYYFFLEVIQFYI